MIKVGVFYGTLYILGFYGNCTVRRVRVVQPLEIGDDYCGEHGINHPIKGADPVTAAALVTWSDDVITAVDVTAASANHTIAFVGTSGGRVKKVLPCAVIFTVSQHSCRPNYRLG